MKLDPDITFGIKTDSDGCDAHALIENINPCTKVTHKNQICVNIDKFRHYLYNLVNFHMFDLKTLLHQFPVDENGCVTFDDIKEAMSLMKLRYNEDHLREAIVYFRIVDGNELTTQPINIDKFLELIHLQHPLPHPPNLTPPPTNFDNKLTTYRLLCADMNKPLPPERKEKAHTLSDEVVTRASDCIAPDIPTFYGLLPSDFEKPRSKEQLKTIFQRLLGEHFETVWALTCKETNQPTDGLISVNSMRKMMNEFQSKTQPSLI